MFLLNALIEKEVKRRVEEVNERRFLHERIDGLEHRVYELKDELYQLRMKTDPEYKNAHTPAFGTCTCDPQMGVN